MAVERVLSFPDALGVVLEHANVLPPAVGVEAVDLQRARGRVLAQALFADRDQPPFDRSTRDGYAVRAEDLTASALSPLRLVGSVRAGEAWRGKAIQEGEAIEIMTGAPLPAGADAVLMLEHANVVDDTLTMSAGRSLNVGENVVPRGSEARSGVQVLPAGRVVQAAEIAVAASCGATALAVFVQPRVAILATGDELVHVEETPEAHQIRNSNTHSLAALVAAEGGEPVTLDIARDTLADTVQRIAKGADCELMLLSGGVSMGKFDVVEQALASRGAEFFFTGALIQPGKPIVFGRMPRSVANDASKERWTYFFGLPGNPISTQVCFHLFVTPLLRAMAGRSDLAPRFVEATLAESVKGPAPVTRFLPAELSGAWDGVKVRVVGWQGSGDVAANARGNCYAVLPAGVAGFAAGETVRVLLR
jgi:molybdopterin molybdotransferase